jgi:hypothetical protein
MPRKNKDTAPSKPTRNYVYEVKALIGDETPRAVGDQMYHAHQFHNETVRIERTRREESHAVICGFDPEIYRLEAAIEGVDEAIEGLLAAIRKRGQDARRRSLATAEERERSAALKKQRAGYRADLKARKAVAYADAGVRARLDPIDATARQADKDAYNASPAYWGTKLVVAKALEGRRTGKPPKFRRWSQHGTVAVQVQHGMEWAEAMLGEDTRVRIQVPAPPEFRRTHARNGAFLPLADPGSVRSGDHKLALVSLRIGTADDGRSPVWARLLVHVHRQPPPDARIKWAFLHRYLVGRQIRWKLRFALARDEWPSEHGEGGVADVDIGWRMTPEGMRIATARGGDGESRTLVLSRRDLDRWHKAESLRAIRDRSFNAIRAGLLDWKAACKGRGKELPEWLAERLEHLHSWKTPDRLQELAWKWKDERFPADRMVIPGMMEWRRGHKRLTEELGGRPLSVFEELAAWRRHDRHLHDWEDNQRGKAIRWRDELYRRFAAIVCRTYRDVRIREVNWAKVKEKAEDGRVDDPVTRLHLQIAAPGTLQRFLIEAAGQDHVEKVPARDWEDGEERDAGRYVA